MPTSHIYDTYAKTAKGRIMHFNVVLDVQDPQQALDYAKAWLQSIGFADAMVTSENCCFCHSLDKLPADLRKQVDERGYGIYKLEGCPK